MIKIKGIPIIPMKFNGSKIKLGIFILRRFTVNPKIAAYINGILKTSFMLSFQGFFEAMETPKE